MYVSDHLSRSALPNRRMEKKERDYEIFTVHAEEQIMKDIDDIDHNLADATLQKLAKANTQDGNLMTLADIIGNGWLEDKTQAPPNVRDYWL